MDDRQQKREEFIAWQKRRIEYLECELTREIKARGAAEGKLREIAALPDAPATAHVTGQWMSGFNCGVECGRDIARSFLERKHVVSAPLPGRVVPGPDDGVSGTA